MVVVVRKKGKRKWRNEGKVSESEVFLKYVTLFFPEKEEKTPHLPDRALHKLAGDAGRVQEDREVSPGGGGEEVLLVVVEKEGRG